MRRWSGRLAALAIASGFAVHLAAATGSAFSGSVCSLVTATQIATIVADASSGKYACHAQPPQTTPAATNYSAKAGSSTVSAGGFLSITVAKYSRPSTEALVRNEFKKSLKPVSGVGDWAYSHIAVSPVYGGTADTGEFVLGANGYSVLFNVRAVQGKSVDQPALKALATSIAAKL
jgi:hypothetical protein